MTVTYPYALNPKQGLEFRISGLHIWVSLGLVQGLGLELKDGFQTLNQKSEARWQRQEGVWWQSSRSGPSGERRRERRRKKTGAAKEMAAKLKERIPAQFGSWMRPIGFRV